MRQSFPLVSLAIAIAAGLCQAPARAAPPQEQRAEHVSYSRDVRPVLSENCFFCHGQDAEKRKGKLRLDTEAGQRLKKRRRQLKPLLLDQSFLAGLGNIYVDEALWWARLHPQRLADSLSDEELEALYHAMRDVLQQANLTKR